MRRSPWLRTLLALVIMVTPVCGSLAFSPARAFAEPAAQEAILDDEIILLESNGRIRVDDPFVPAGGQQVTWSSGADIGWTAVAAGDFNGDGDAEIAAVRGGTLKVFDPIPRGGPAVLYEYTLPVGLNFRLIVTADFNNDGRDDIATTHSDTGTGIVETVKVFSGGATGANWSVIWNAQFGSQWQDIATGDFNSDNYDDLVLVRNVDRRIMVYGGGPTTLNSLASQSGYATDWLALAGGNIFADNPGDEIALERDSVNAQTNALILVRVAGGTLVDAGGGANYRYNPNFSSLALGDLNGDGDAEILLLRDPTVDGIASLIMVNPAGVAMRDFRQTIGFGATAWKLVRAGDIDGDRRAEVVVLRADRYRIYREPELSDNFTELLGSFLVSSAPSNIPTMAVADVDGVLGPSLGVNPLSLAFNLEYSQPSPTQTVRISNVSTSDVLAWQAQVTEGASWLRIGATSGTTPADLGVSVVTDGLGLGTHTGKIRISSTTAGVVNSPQDVTVTLTLTGVALQATPGSLVFNAAYGEAPARQTISIRTAGGSGIINWQMDVLEGAAWLSVSRRQGVTPSDPTVSANTVAAGPGVHTGTIRVRATDSGVLNSPQFVNVQLTVPDPGFVVRPSTVLILQEAAAPEVTKQVEIWRPGGTATWTTAVFPAASSAAFDARVAAGEDPLTAAGLLAAAAETDWLVYTPTGGTTPFNARSYMTISIKPGTPPGTYRARIVVGASGVTPPAQSLVKDVLVTGIVTLNVRETYLPLVLY